MRLMPHAHRDVMVRTGLRRYPALLAAMACALALFATPGTARAADAAQGVKQHGGLDATQGAGRADRPAPIRIRDNRGTIAFASVPRRVVVLDWDLLEQVLELGITPVGAPELAGYREWVVQPPLPAMKDNAGGTSDKDNADTVTDVGTRAEPNLERIAGLHPDVILTASPQKDLLDALARIAPVVHLPNFAATDRSGEVAIAHFTTLAALFGRQELARQKLEDMHRRFAELKAQLAAALGPSARVLPLRFANTTSVFAYCENSTARYVLDQLGLTDALPQQPRAWGITRMPFKDLHALADAWVLYVLPFPEEAKMRASVLWQSMPFVRQGRIRSVRPVWNYGGAMSMRYLADAFAESLLRVEAAQ